MKDKKIEQLKTIKENYLKTGDAKQFKESIKNLPPEMLELFNAALKTVKDGIYDKYLPDEIDLNEDVPFGD